MANPRQQCFRFIVYLGPVCTVHHVIQCLAQTIGEQRKFLLKIVQKNHAPNVKYSCQNNAADDNTHIFRQQEKNQQQQSGSEQSPRHNFSQKCPDR